MKVAPNITNENITNEFDGIILPRPLVQAHEQAPGSDHAILGRGLMGWPVVGITLPYTGPKYLES